MDLPTADGRRGTRTYKKILRAIAVRLGVYTLLCLIVVFALIDLRTLPGRQHASRPKVEDPTAAGPGWTHFGGPTYDFHSTETDLADAWPADGPPVLWRKEIGAGYSGLIVRGGVAYTQTQSLTEQKVIALDADTGQAIWEHKYGWPYQPGGMFPGPRATPTWADGRVYFAAPNGLVGCLDAINGTPLWSVNVIEQFEGRGAIFGYACSPVVEEGMVILPVGGPQASVVALDAKTGAVRWKSGSAQASYASALPITFRGRRQVVAFLRNSLAGFELQTGRLLWEQADERGHEEHAATPLYLEPHLRVMQAYRAGSDLYELEPITAAAADDGVDVPGVGIKRLRRDTQMSNDVASSVLVDSFVYGFDLREQQASRGRPSRGTFRCMEWLTGKVRWSSDRPGQASIVVADGKLLMFNDSGDVLLVRANPNAYEELARAPVFSGETCWTPPALDQGRLYVRSPTHAACIVVGNPERMSPGQLAQVKPLAAMPKSGPADRTWLIGREREYPFEMPDFRELRGWYLFSLAAFAAAALLAGFAYGLTRLCTGRPQTVPSTLAFWGGLIVFGVVATPLANRLGGSFVFTWPLTLIAVHQIALWSVSCATEQTERKSARWISFAGVGFLVLTSVLYFKLTRQLSLAPAWYFLLMLPAAWPIAIPAARRLCRPRRIAADVVWALAVYSIFFWAAGAVMLLRTASM